MQGDGVINAGQTRGGPIPVADRSWDALFHSGAQIVEDGYTAEMAIPFKSFRYPDQPPGAEHRWGFQIVREIRGTSSRPPSGARTAPSSPSCGCCSGTDADA